MDVFNWIKDSSKLSLIVGLTIFLIIAIGSTLLANYKKVSLKNRLIMEEFTLSTIIAFYTNQLDNRDVWFDALIVLECSIFIVANGWLNMRYKMKSKKQYKIKLWVEKDYRLESRNKK